jgi:hypothetical protein
MKELHPTASQRHKWNRRVLRLVLFEVAVVIASIAFWKFIYLPLSTTHLEKAWPQAVKIHYNQEPQVIEKARLVGKNLHGQEASEYNLAVSEIVGRQFQLLVPLRQKQMAALEMYYPDILLYCYARALFSNPSGPPTHIKKVWGDRKCSPQDIIKSFSASP